jgi:diketogulonate reductase-like aldo/keto reductase
MVNDAGAGNGGVDRKIDCSTNLHEKWARRVDLYLLAFALKLPGRHCATAEATSQASVAEQITRVLGTAKAIKVVGRCSGREALDTWPYWNCDHVSFQPFVIADPSITASRNNIYKAVVGDNFQSDLGISGKDGSWIAAFSPKEVTQAVYDNLRNLGLDVLDVVNLRCMFDVHHPAEGSIEAQLIALAKLQQQGLVRHIGLSNVTFAQIEAALRVCEVVCVQNYYNLAHRHDDALIDELAYKGIAYVPFFPLGGFSPLQSSTLSNVASRLGNTPMQVALAWLLHRSPNILLIPGTSSVTHLRENLAAAQLTLSPEILSELDGIVSYA